MNALEQKVRETYRLIRERGDDGVWISLVAEEDALRLAASVEDEGRDLPLRGMTFAVKDNIDVAGLPTTAACPEFSYLPDRNAFVVQRLIEAGAVVIGKTNLDQFATGLNGSRTPHVIPRNSVDPAYISGGSSSGSAIAVALGEVDFALGTDTAGSGRVPAAFNNLVGFKPTRGRWSGRGLVPACRSLDCITMLSRSLALAAKVDGVVKAFDEEDFFSRRERTGICAATGRVAVLPESQREFFGDTDYARLYQEAVDRLAGMGCELREFDYTPFLEAAALLYSGPWVAERFAAIRDFLEKNADSVHPVVREIIEGGTKFSAADAFAAQYRLAEHLRHAEKFWETFDAMLLPTAGTIYTVEQMLDEPVKLNSNLGRYTNFVNLLDMCGIAVPAGFRADGIPFGVTFIGPAWSENVQFDLAAQFLGEASPVATRGIKLAVVGAHLRGQPLNPQLQNLGAKFVTATRTAPVYRFYALPDSFPPKPGLVRAGEGGPIEVEVYELSEEAFGRFVAAIPAPLGIGSVVLEGGETVKGFLCEEIAVREAREITSFGGWRAFLASDG